jgi:hypothetical protein
LPAAHSGCDRVVHRRFRAAHKIRVGAVLIFGVNNGLIG